MIIHITTRALPTIFSINLWVGVLPWYVFAREGGWEGFQWGEARQGARGRRSLSELLEALWVALPWCAYHSLGQKPQYLIHYLPAPAALDFPILFEIIDS